MKIRWGILSPLDLSKKKNSPTLARYVLWINYSGNLYYQKKNYNGKLRMAWQTEVVVLSIEAMRIAPRSASL